MNLQPVKAGLRCYNWARVRTAEGRFGMENLADIGLIGLAVMGQNLALNINDHGYRVAVFNRTNG